jgi:hypothetical protein
VRDVAVHIRNDVVVRRVHASNDLARLGDAACQHEIGAAGVVWPHRLRHGPAQRQQFAWRQSHAVIRDYRAPTGHADAQRHVAEARSGAAQRHVAEARSGAALQDSHAIFDNLERDRAVTFEIAIRVIRILGLDE